MGNSWLVKERIRSRTPSPGRRVSVLDFGRKGRREGPTEPTESHLERPFSKSLGRASSLGTCNVHLNSKQPKVSGSQAGVRPFPSGPLWALPLTSLLRAGLQQRNGSDMSIMRESGHWAHRARRTHLPKMGRSLLGWIHPRILREAVTRPGISVLRRCNEPFWSFYCATNPIEKWPCQRHTQSTMHARVAQQHGRPAGSRV